MTSSLSAISPSFETKLLEHRRAVRYDWPTTSGAFTAGGPLLTTMLDLR